MGNVERLGKMRHLADKLSDDLFKEKRVLGVLLYGSIVSGKIHEKSDIDIATIYDASDDTYPLREEKVIEGFKVDIWRYPINRFIQIFDDEKLRDKTSTWIRASPYLELMRDCRIIKDPKYKLYEWKAKAKNWKWRESEIKPVKKRITDSLQLLKDTVTMKDEFSLLLCLRDTTALLVSIYLMRSDLIPTWMPKDPWTTLINPLKRAGHEEIIDLFIKVKINSWSKSM